MISSRHAPALCVALALALVPTVIHTYAGSVDDDGRTIEAIPAALADVRFVQTDRGPSWGRTIFASDEWFERKTTASRLALTLTVARSYDWKRLYHHPEIAVARGVEFVREETVRLPERSDVPVRVLYTREGDAIAVSAMHYGNTFVEDPIRFQVRTAGELLFSARKAMTLFFVQQRGSAKGVEVSRLDATRVLYAAIDQFLAQRPSAD
jgi:hypothetical protein